MTDELKSNEPKKLDVRPSAHCWADYQNYDTGESFTCLLEDEHEGDHVWTNDEKITVRFNE